MILPFFIALWCFCRQLQSQNRRVLMPTMRAPHHRHWLSTTSRLRLASERMADSSAGVGF